MTAGLYGRTISTFKEIAKLSDKVAALVYLDYHIKILQTGWLKEQKFIFLQSWELEIQDQDARKFGFCKHSLPGFRWPPSHSVLTRPSSV